MSKNRQRSLGKYFPLPSAIFSGIEADARSNWSFTSAIRTGPSMNIDGHRIAQDVDVAIALRQAFRERLPLVAAGLAAIDAKFAFGRIMFAVALDRDDVNGFGFVRVDVDGETEIGGQVAAYLAPVFA